MKVGDRVTIGQFKLTSVGYTCPVCGGPPAGSVWACGFSVAATMTQGQWIVASECRNVQAVAIAYTYSPGQVIAPLVPMVDGGNCPLCGEVGMDKNGHWFCGGPGSWLAGKRNQEYRIITVCSKYGSPQPVLNALHTYRAPQQSTCTCESLLDGCKCGAFQQERLKEIRERLLKDLSEEEKLALGVR